MASASTRSAEAAAGLLDEDSEFLYLSLSNPTAASAQPQSTTVTSATAAPSPSSVRTTLGPLVLFSVLDHYIRRPSDDEPRVIGALLGVRSDDGAGSWDVEIRNCFPLSLEMDANGIPFINSDFLQQMYGLHQRVNPKEFIVGWYATGSTVDDSSLAIHDYFVNEIYPHQPVHLLLDTKMVNERLSIKSFIRSVISVPLTEAQEQALEKQGIESYDGGMFIQVPCNINYVENERVAVDMISASKELPDGLQLLSDMDNLERSIVTIQGMLESIETYVTAVREGKVVANNAVGRFLMDTISSVPRINVEEFEKVFNNHLQDLLMVVYLSNLTRAQLAIAQRLQRLT